MERTSETGAVSMAILTSVADETVQLIHALKDIFSSCYGPSGKAKIISNKCHAHMALTSTSKRLLENMIFSHPFSKLIQAGIQQHLVSCGDGGLYLGILLLSLVENGLKSELPPQLCSDVNEIILQYCDDIFAMPLCSQMRLDIGNSKMMLGFVRSIFCSKPACILRKREVDFISSLLLQSFLESLPLDADNHSDNIVDLEYRSILAQPVLNTCFEKGVFIEVPNKNFQEKRVFEQSGAAKRKVALFKLSVTNDKDLFPELNLEGTVEINQRNAVLRAFSDVVEKLEKLGVSLVCCQKVLHPSLKRLLRQRGILFLERLAITNIGAVQRITGCKPLTSLHPENIHPSSLGEIDSLQLTEICQKSFIRLQSEKENVLTVFLCHRTDDCLQELKHVFKVAITSLKIALKKPNVVPGAGCFEASLATEVFKKVETVSSEELDSIGCRRHQFITAADCFVKSLTSIPLNLHNYACVIDSTYSHVWVKGQSNSSSDNNLKNSQMCACGLLSQTEGMDFETLGHESLNFFQKFKSFSSESKTFQSEMISSGAILDLAFVKQGAIRIAVEVANMVLCTGLIVHNQN